MNVLKYDGVMKKSLGLDYYFGFFLKILCSTTLMQSFIARAKLLHWYLCQWGTFAPTPIPTSQVVQCQKSPGWLGLNFKKLKYIRKISKRHRFIAQCSVFHPNSKLCQYQQKNIEKQKLNFSHSALFHMKTRVCLKYFVHYFVWKQLSLSTSSQIPLSLICWTILETLRLSTQF